MWGNTRRFLYDASPVRENLWEVTGDLTIARVERSIEANRGEDYAGPMYGERVTHSVTRAGAINPDS